jgi:beta-xylosidase
VRDGRQPLAAKMRVRELQGTVVESSRLGIPAIVRAGLFGHGASGEGCDAEDLNLPGTPAGAGGGDPAGRAADRAGCSVGSPVRARSVPAPRRGNGASLLPGRGGGTALAGVLSGRVNPSGKLLDEVPRHTGGQPHTYLAAPLGLTARG